MVTNLTTDRLTLNRLTTEDADFIKELVNTEGWLRFIGDRNVHSKEDAVNYVEKIARNQNVHYWVVRLKEEGTSIGIITFLKRDYLEHFDIGFAFLPQYNGKGYAYEASRKILSMMGSKPEHSTILATTLSGNINSIRLLSKLGLRFDREIEIGNELLQIYSISF
jgi:RimJ/RimL family protein N-acetyltransferase